MTNRVTPSPLAGAFCWAIADPVRNSASPNAKTQIIFLICLLRGGQVTHHTFTPNTRREQYLPCVLAPCFERNARSSSYDSRPSGPPISCGGECGAHVGPCVAAT